MENNDLKEKVRKNIKEKIAVSNIRKEFDMKNKNNTKVIYAILSTCAVSILCVGIIINTKFPTNITNDSNLAKSNSITQEEKSTTKDIIVFNNGNLQCMADIDANWKDANLKEEFNFINKIYVPKGLELARQGKIYVKPNGNYSEEYSKLRQYSLIYSTKSTEDPSQVEIIFTKEQNILGCMIPDEEQMQNSIINGKEIKLFKGEYILDEGKIVGNAFFEKDGYKFYINAHRIEEEEFINVVKSILNN
ncbi:MAG: hypothetical protein ACLUD1_03210 [Clostridia bacterium]